MASPWILGFNSGWWDELPRSTKLLGTSIALVAALLIGALLIALVDRWRRKATEACLLDTNDQLAQFRLLYERGDLSREEFERIRERLGGRLRKELDVTPPPQSSVETPRPPESPETGTRPV